MRYKIYRIDTYSVNVIFCYYRLIKIKKKERKDFINNFCFNDDKYLQYMNYFI